MLNLPGLNADFSKYKGDTFKGKTTKKIPFADWLPPDFVDVLCTIKNDPELRVGYYSPGRNVIVAEFKGIATEFKAEEMDYWLKVTVE